MTLPGPKLLEVMREVGDPLADEVAAQLCEDWELAHKLFARWTELDGNATPVPRDLPACVRDYFERTQALPADADPVRLRAGSEAFCENGLLAVLILFTASLVEAYSGRKGAQVLYVTQRLEGDFKRRVAETAQFVLDVMSPCAFSERGYGVRTTQKVRLMHAIVRHRLLQQDWPTDLIGVPINQADMAGTVQTFAAVVVRGLARYGARMEPDERDGYMHSWRVIGQLLGVHPELLPEDAEDGRTLLDRILGPQQEWEPEDGRPPVRGERWDEAGVELTRALVTFMRETLPGPTFDGLVESNIRYLVGPRVAALVGLGQAHWSRALVPLERAGFGATDWITDRSGILERLSGRLSLRVLRGIKRAQVRGYGEPGGRICLNVRAAFEERMRVGRRDRRLPLEILTRARPDPEPATQREAPSQPQQSPAAH